MLIKEPLWRTSGRDRRHASCKLQLCLIVLLCIISRVDGHYLAPEFDFSTSEAQLQRRAPGVIADRIRAAFQKSISETAAGVAQREKDRQATQAHIDDNVKASVAQTAAGVAQREKDRQATQAQVDTNFKASVAQTAAGAAHREKDRQDTQARVNANVKASVAQTAAGAAAREEGRKANLAQTGANVENRQLDAESTRLQKEIGWIKDQAKRRGQFDPSEDQPDNKKQRKGEKGEKSAEKAGKAGKAAEAGKDAKNGAQVASKVMKTVSDVGKGGGITAAVTQGASFVTSAVTDKNVFSFDSGKTVDGVDKQAAPALAHQLESDQILQQKIKERKDKKLSYNPVLNRARAEQEYGQTHEVKTGPNAMVTMSTGQHVKRKEAAGINTLLAFSNTPGPLGAGLKLAAANKGWVKGGIPGYDSKKGAQDPANQKVKAKYFFGQYVKTGLGIDPEDIKNKKNGQSAPSTGNNAGDVSKTAKVGGKGLGSLMKVASKSTSGSGKQTLGKMASKAPSIFGQKNGKNNAVKSRQPPIEAKDTRKNAKANSQKPAQQQNNHKLTAAFKGLVGKQVNGKQVNGKQVDEKKAESKKTTGTKWPERTPATNPTSGQQKPARKPPPPGKPVTNPKPNSKPLTPGPLFTQNQPPTHAPAAKPNEVSKVSKPNTSALKAAPVKGKAH